MVDSNYSTEDVSVEDMQDRMRAEARDGAEERLTEKCSPRVFANAIGWKENVKDYGFGQEE